MLEGLDYSVIKLSELERTKRIDSEYFLRQYIGTFAALANLKKVSVDSVASISDGNHFSISDEFVDSGVPYYRGQDVVGNFFIEQAAPVFISDWAFRQPHMTRSRLQKGDVLLSIVGTIGELSLVTLDSPGTCSCKLAILRPTDISPEYLAIFLSSKFGRNQIKRLTRGAVQMGLVLDDMDQLSIVRLSPSKENRIKLIVLQAHKQLQHAVQTIKDAEQSLIRALGLEKWHPPEPLTYTRRASEAFATKRLDSQFFFPRYEALREALEKQYEVRDLGEIGAVHKGVTVPYYEDGSIPIIRSGDLSDISDDERFLRSKPIERIFYLERGDVLISSIGFGSIGKVQVFDKPGLYGTVSEVSVVRQKEMNPYYLTFFLRSSVGQMQIERYITGATGQLHLYPRDVARIFIPVISEAEQAKFQQLAESANAARYKARELLECAKRAVEIAIEEDEDAALRYLDQQPE